MKNKRHELFRYELPNQGDFRKTLLAARDALSAAKVQRPASRPTYSVFFGDYGVAVELVQVESDQVTARGFVLPVGKSKEAWQSIYATPDSVIPRVEMVLPATAQKIGELAIFKFDT